MSQIETMANWRDLNRDAESMGLDVRRLDPSPRHCFARRRAKPFRPSKTVILDRRFRVWVERNRQMLDDKRDYSEFQIDCGGFGPLEFPMRNLQVTYGFLRHRVATAQR